MINSAETYVWFVMKNLVNCKLYAIYRCTRALVSFNISKKIYFMQPEGNTNCNGMSHSGLGFVGSYYYYFSKIFNCFNEISDTGSCNAIIVRNQDHRFLLVFCHSGVFLATKL